MAEFKQKKYTEPVSIILTRAQIQQMNEMVDHFKEQNEFELKSEDGKISFHFTMEFKK